MCHDRNTAISDMEGNRVNARAEMRLRKQAAQLGFGVAPARSNNARHITFPFRTGDVYEHGGSARCSARNRLERIERLENRKRSVLINRLLGREMDA